MIVYLITNSVNGKQYVGQTTTSLAKRLKRHFYEFSWKTGMPITLAIRKYGSNVFEARELCSCSTQKELDEMEAFYANKLGTFSPAGYNLKAGSGSGSMAEETKAKIKTSLAGRSLSPEHKAKLLTAHLGKTHSDATKQKLSKFWKGRIFSAKQRSKISKAVAKTYSLISPAGNPTTIVNMRAFCEQHALSRTRMSALVNGHLAKYRGWTRD